MDWSKAMVKRLKSTSFVLVRYSALSHEKLKQWTLTKPRPRASLSCFGERVGE